MRKNKKEKNDEAEEHRKYASTLNKEPLSKPTKTQRKITELKNPYNVTIDEEDARLEYGLRLENTREAYESNKRKRIDDEDTEFPQHAQALHLMPQRQNQTKDTLTIESNLTGRIYDNDVYENLRQVNGKLYAEREAKVFPLEKLVSLGLVTPQKYTLDERQDSISRQLHAKCDTMKLQLAQIRHQPPQPITLQKQQKRQENVTLVKELSRKADINENQNSTNVKLTLLLGQQTHPFGYTRFASNDHRNFTFKVYDEEKEKLRANFFQSDPLEDETPFGSIPLKFNIYHRLVAQNQKKYENYEERMTRGNTLTPLSSHEYLNKEERKKYRRRPGPDTPLCSNGIRCLFYTFSNDPEIQYIGAAFFTPKQLERMEDNKKNKSTMRGLCIDCLEIRSKPAAHPDDGDRHEPVHRTRNSRRRGGADAGEPASQLLVIHHAAAKPDIPVRAYRDHPSAGNVGQYMDVDEWTPGS
jgi:hypothetical protein